MKVTPSATSERDAGTEPQGQQREAVARGAFFVSGAKLVMLVTGLIVQVALARMLGVELYGLYGLIFSILVWFELFMTGATKTSSMEVARAPGEARSFQFVALKVQAPLSLVILVLGVALSFFLPAMFNRPGTAGYFVLAFLDIPLMGLVYLYQGLLNGLQLYRYQSTAITIYYFSRMVLSIVLVSAGLSLTGAILANILCSLIGWGFALRFFLAHADELTAKSGVSPRALLRETVPFIVLPIIFNVLVFSNMWVVGALASEVDMGMYNAAFTMSRLLLVFYNSLTIAMFPAISSSIASGDTARSNRLIRQSHRFLLILVAPTSFFLAASSQTVLRIFGGGYTGGGDSMAILAFGFLGLAFLSMLNDIQLADRHFWRVIAINLSAMVIEIGLAFPLTRSMGLAGAALSLVIACTSACVLQFGFIRQRFGSPMSLQSVCRILAAAGACAAVLMPVDSLWVLFPAYAGAALLYLLLINFLGEMDTGEMRYWFEVVTGKRRSFG